MLRARHWRIHLVFRLVMMVLMSFAVASLLILLFSDLGARLWPAWVIHPKEFTAFLFGAFVVDLGIAISIGFFVREHDVSWRAAFGFTEIPIPRAALAGLAAAVFMLPTTWLLQNASAWLLTKAGLPASSQETVDLLVGEPSSLVRSIFLFFAVFLAPVVEEMLFRGVLFVAIRDLGWRRLGFALSAVAFGAVHMNWAAFIPLTFFGLVQAWLYERTGSLVAPIVAHSLFNLAPFIMLHFGISLGDEGGKL